MIEGLRIRRAAGLDDRRLATIAYDTWSSSTSTGPLRDAAAPFFDPDEGVETANTLVAFSPQAVVGFVVVAPFPYGHERWVVRALAVDALFQRRGVGTVLVQEAVAAAAAAGARLLTAEVRPANEGAVVALSRSGFRAEPSGSATTDGAAEAVATMVLSPVQRAVPRGAPTRR